MEDHSIAVFSLQCSQHFLSIKRDVAAQTVAEESSTLPEGFPVRSFSDIFARFRTWIENIGALSRGKSSLDQRIRHSYLRDEVIRLLNQMIVVLDDLIAILHGDREQQTWYEGSGIATELMDSDSDTDSDINSIQSDGMPTPEEDDPRLVTESSQLGMMLDNSVKSLLKLSLFIQKSSRRAKFARSSREQPYDTKFDILHVLESFPHAANNILLIERLGKANVQRRQWLSYRKRHRERLSSFGGSATDPTPGYDFLFAEAESQRPSDLASMVSFSSGPPLSSLTTDNSTTATTFYNDVVEPFGLNDREEETSEVSFSASSVSGKEKTPLEIPCFPPEGTLGEPFECPFCCTIISVRNLQSWIKHVHADLASYVCTFENCSQPPFESRIQWFSHEMDCHRRVWSCPYCEKTALEEHTLEQHIQECHSNQVSHVQIRGLVRQTSRPLQRLPASSCPLCDYSSILRGRLPALSETNAIMIKPEQLRSHLGRHLEQLAIFVLPKSALMHDVEGEDDDDDNENAESEATDSDFGDEVDDMSKQNQQLEMNVEEIVSVLASHPSTVPDILHEAPALALGWQPPHDFTPPIEYFETDDEDLTPRREESTFGGDLFTPGWVRGYDKTKEGWCGRCEVGHWVNIPSGDYEFHLTYLHGLPYTGLPLPRPSAIREIEDRAGSWEAFCDMCESWRVLRHTKQGWNWWRHCLTEHESNIANVSATIPLVGEEVQQAPIDDVKAAIMCIYQGNYEAYNRLLNTIPEIITAKNADNKTPLHFAAEAGQIQFVRLTLQSIQIWFSKQDAENIINSQSHKGFTPIMLAVYQGNDEVVKELAKSGANIHLLAANGMNALDLAAHAGYNFIAEILIRRGAKVEDSRIFRENYLVPRKLEMKTNVTMPALTDITSSWNNLMLDASKNRVDGVLDCLSQGADIEETAKDGSTALTIAVLRGNEEAAEVLIKNGANLNAINVKGWTALMVAVRDAKISVVAFLLAHGADVNHLSPDHWTALAEAAQSGHTEIMEMLLQHGADTEVRSSHDWTPLMHACYRGDQACVERLLKSGAGVESGSQRDETPMLLAAAAGHQEVIEILLAAGGRADAAWARKPEALETHISLENIERTYQLGWTPLMTACQNGHEEVVRLLLEAGANTEPRSPLKRNVLEIARENGRTAIVRMLETYIKDE